MAIANRGFSPGPAQVCRLCKDFDEEVVYLSNDLGVRCRACCQGRGTLISRNLSLRIRITEKLSPVKFGEDSRDETVQLKWELSELTHQLLGRVLERAPRINPTLVH
jgi:hypothetical protein